MRLLVYIATAMAVSGCAGPSPNAWYNSPQPLNQRQSDDASNWCASLEPDAQIKEVNINDIASALHGGDFDKKEFETTADYERRLSGRLEKTRQLIRKATGTDRVVFSVPLAGDLIKYNADTGLMIIGHEYSGLLRTTHTSAGDMIVTKSSRKTAGTYIGENAFGVKKRIERILGYNIGINAPEGSSLGWPSSFGANSFKPIHIYVPRDEARPTKDALSVLFIGQMKAPYLKQGTDRYTPKIDAPYDQTIASQAVQIEFDCAAIYNRATGKVIQSLPTTRMRPRGGF